jgi:K+-transporting ATPase ATPase C chain
VKIFLQSLMMLIVFTVLTGVIYPLLVTISAQVVSFDKASGQIVSCKGSVIGSKLMAQKFSKPQFFWPRPSAADYNPLATTGSNLSPQSSDLKKQYEDRKKALESANPAQAASSSRPPQDLLFASASGVDPEISPEAAKYQVARIAKAREFDEAQKTALAELVDSDTQLPSLGFIGEARVNVLKLNMALEGCD